MGSESSSTKCERCGHTHKRNTHTCGWRFTDTSTCECKGPRPCVVDWHMHTGGPTDRPLDTCRYDADPPLTPEEEEQAPEDGEGTWPCDDCGAQVPASADWCTNPDCQEIAKQRLAAEAPPQPERRPPYAVAYSVDGHLYEVAVSGDATVRAVDGALIITHHLGPVAGIVQAAPILSEES